MSFFFIYLLKLFVSLAVVFLFYHFVLRKLTFYNWNRWYLLGYTLLSFFIPFIDVSAVLEKNEWADSPVVQWVPVINNPSVSTTDAANSGGVFTGTDITAILVITGMFVLLVRLFIQFVSFRKMMKKAQYISGSDMKIYQVDENIIPFSFGNSIFINRHLHSETELQEIIRHEFVHVRQIHSMDIIWGELLCLLNWYNPFAWLLKKSIRQNLEFIADNKVLENGVNKKEYQYLLLKVTGNNQYSIATQFNFSSLKKRIAMMDKMKSAKMHLLRFLFLLPVLAIILVSFRKEIGDTLRGKKKQATPDRIENVTDTIPAIAEPNSKGYVIYIIGNKGDCKVIIQDKAGKEVKRLLLTEWNANKEKYENLYGEIPPPPPPAAPTAPGTVDYPIPPTPPASPTAPGSFDYPTPPTPPAKKKSNGPQNDVGNDNAMVDKPGGVLTMIVPVKPVNVIPAETVTSLSIKETKSSVVVPFVPATPVVPPSVTVPANKKAND